MTYEANFVGLLSFLNGMQIGKAVTESSIATSVMTFQDEFKEIMNNLNKGTGKNKSN
jgi:hypothetical protein